MATVATERTQDIISKCVIMAADMLKLSIQHVWLDYDKEADVLYISFRRPQRANKTFEMDNDILIRKEGRNIVGITILNASSRK